MGTSDFFRILFCDIKCLVLFIFIYYILLVILSSITLRMLQITHSFIDRYVYKDIGIEKIVGHFSIPQVTIFYYKSIIDGYLSQGLKNSSFLSGKTYIYYLSCH